MLEAVAQCKAKPIIVAVVDRLASLTKRIQALPPPSNESRDPIEAEREALLKERLNYMNLTTSLLSAARRTDSAPDERAAEFPKLISSQIVTHVRSALALDGSSEGSAGHTVRVSLMKVGLCCSRRGGGRETPKTVSTVVCRCSRSACEEV